jgi:hypothetical protein
MWGDTTEGLCGRLSIFHSLIHPPGNGFPLHHIETDTIYRVHCTDLFLDQDPALNREVLDELINP